MSSGGRIGVFGGTFDPPHIGHLAVAVEVRHALALDRVLMVVANDPWQKRGARVLTPAADRLEMVRAAVEDLDGIEADDREIRRGGPSYTVDTVEELLGEQPQAEVFVVVGADAAAGLRTWERADELAALVTVVVVRRPGFDLSDRSVRFHRCGGGGARPRRVELGHQGPAGDGSAHRRAGAGGRCHLADQAPHLSWRGMTHEPPARAGQPATGAAARLAALLSEFERAAGRRAPPRPRSPPRPAGRTVRRGTHSENGQALSALAGPGGGARRGRRRDATAGLRRTDRDRPT